MQPVMVMFAYKGFGLRNLMHSKIDFIEYFGRRQEKKNGQTCIKFETD